MNVEIRDATTRDAAAIADIFYHTVLNVNVRDYSGAQVDAWAGSAPEPGKWEERIAAGERQTFVAVQGERLLGFAEFEGDGHIDTLYVHHESQGCGIASRLLDRIESEAQLLGVARLYTEASITARPFFQRRGFSIVTPQMVKV
ncbi:MAG TPA: GNAT family N-acetyltransferase, partial [Rubrobacter sp.]|nr:GNAT family N-acetyltransferase [Rubrobacter sp.]